MSEQTTKAKAFDFDTLTLGEVATIEDLSGYGIGALDKQTPQGKFLAALYMVAKRRSGEPTFTFNQALRVSISEAQTFLGIEDEDEDETDDDDDGQPTAEPDEAAIAPVDTPDYDVSADEGKGETFGGIGTD